MPNGKKNVPGTIGVSRLARLVTAPPLDVVKKVVEAHHGMKSVPRRTTDQR